MQYDGYNSKAIYEFTNRGVAPSGYQGLSFYSNEDETPRIVKDDWVVKDENGNFYSVKPDIFKATYEEVEE